MPRQKNSPSLWATITFCILLLLLTAGTFRYLSDVFSTHVTSSDGVAFQQETEAGAAPNKSSIPFGNQDDSQPVIYQNASLEFISAADTNELWKRYEGDW